MSGTDAIAIANSAVGAVLAFVLSLAIIGKVRNFGAFTIVTLGGLGTSNAANVQMLKSESTPRNH